MRGRYPLPKQTDDCDSAESWLPVSPPKWMAAEAKAIYRRLRKQMIRARILSDLDRETFIAFCVASGEVEISSRTIEETGRTYTTDTGHIKPHPSTKLLDSALAKVASLGATLGLSPCSRSRLGIEPEKDKPDPLGELLNRANRRSEN